MKRRTSFFNGAIFRSDLKRFWWISALHSIALLLGCLMPFFLTYSDTLRAMQRATNSANVSFRLSELFEYSYFAYALLLILPVATAALLFSYLNGKRAASTLHAYPVKRKTLYVTHTLFGLISTLVPIALASGVLAFMRLNSGIYQILSLSHIGSFFVTQCVYGLVIFSFSVLIGMLVGNSVAHLVLTYIFAVLPLLAELGVITLFDFNLFGYYAQMEPGVTVSYLYFTPAKLCSVKPQLLYVLYSVIFLVTGYVLYKRRALENHGEVIAFSKLKPVFVYGVSLCFGMLGYFYCAAVFRVEHLLLAIPCGFLGLIIANMLMKKAFTLKGILKPILAFSLSVIALFLVFRFDLSGYERRMPRLENIKSVSVTQSLTDNTYGPSAHGRKLVKEYVYTPYLTEEADIKRVLSLHEYKISERNKKHLSNNTIFLTYQLENGKTLMRYYPISYTNDAAYLKPIFESEENRKDRFPVLTEADRYTTTLTICDTRLEGEFGIYPVTFAEQNAETELMEALKKDLLQVSYEEFIHNSSVLTSIRIESEIPWVYEDDRTPAYFENGRPNTYIDTNRYYVRPTYKNTIAVLEKMGFYDAIPKAEDYTSVTVSPITDPNTTVTEKSVEVYPAEYVDVIEPVGNTTEDPAKIAEIYHYITSVHPVFSYDELGRIAKNSTVSVRFDSVTKKTFRITWNKNDENMPAALKALIG